MLLLLENLNFSLLLDLLLSYKVLFKLLQALIVDLNSNLLCGLLNSPRWQIQVADQALRAHIDSVGFCENNRFGNLLSIGLVPAAVLDLDVKVQRAL